MRLYLWIRILVLLAGAWLMGPLLVAGQPVTNAAPITLGWDPSADPGVQGYAVYYGPMTTGNLTRIPTGTNLICRLTNLMVGTTYRIYAVSYSALGVESLPSNEVFYKPTVPAVPVPRLQITRLANGNMRLQYPAPAAGNYAVQFAATPDAPQWQTLTNVALGAAAEIAVTDVTARKVKQRFYRIAHSAQPLVVALSVARQSTGHAKLTALAPPEAYVQIQFTAQLGGSWIPLTQVFADAEGRVAYTDTAAPPTGNRYYRMVVLPTPPLTHMTITRLANGHMKLTGTAPAGAVCRVLYAPQMNSANWPVLATVTANAEGQLEYIDSTASQAGSRFYRFFLP
jgi:hypothetical protein